MGTLGGTKKTNLWKSKWNKPNKTMELVNQSTFGKLNATCSFHF